MRLEMNMKDHGDIRVEEDVIVENGHIRVVEKEPVRKVNHGKKTTKRNSKSYR